VWYVFEGDYLTTSSAALNMDQHQPIDLARQARAAQIVKRVKQIYNFGVRANRHLEKKPHLTDFVAQQRLGGDSVRKAQRFAKAYSLTELDRFCSLRKPDKMPLSWRHATELAKVDDRRARRMLEIRAAKEGWTGTELAQAIRLHAGKQQGYGGRKVKGPASAELLLQQLVTETERWNRRFREIWAPGGQLKLAGLTDRRGRDHAAQARALTKRGCKALAIMQEAAGQAKADLRGLGQRVARTAR
jgi:hypothetical protein